MFVLGVIVGVIVTCAVGFFVLVWVAKKSYMLGRKDEKGGWLHVTDG